MNFRSQLILSGIPVTEIIARFCTGFVLCFLLGIGGLIRFYFQEAYPPVPPRSNTWRPEITIDAI